MRTLIVLAATASVLALGACNRETETAPAATDATMGAESTATDSAAMDASGATSSATDGSRSTSSSREPTAVADGETMDPAGSAASGSSGSGIGPVTDTTRDGAKEAAEATNLQPQPSGQ